VGISIEYQLRAAVIIHVLNCANLSLENNPKKLSISKVGTYIPDEDLVSDPSLLPEMNPIKDDLVIEGFQKGFGNSIDIRELSGPLGTPLATGSMYLEQFKNSYLTEELAEMFPEVIGSYRRLATHSQRIDKVISHLLETIDASQGDPLGFESEDIEECIKTEFTSIEDFTESWHSATDAFLFMKSIERAADSGEPITKGNLEMGTGRNVLNSFYMPIINASAKMIYCP